METMKFRSFPIVVDNSVFLRASADKSNDFKLKLNLEEQVFRQNIWGINIHNVAISHKRTASPKILRLTCNQIKKIFNLAPNVSQQNEDSDEQTLEVLYLEATRAVRKNVYKSFRRNHIFVINEPKSTLEFHFRDLLGKDASKFIYPRYCWIHFSFVKLS